MAWQIGLIALGPIGWAAAAVTTAAAVGYGIYKACSDDDTSSTSPVVVKDLILFTGEQEAGKSALVHWIVNNSFNKDYAVTETYSTEEGCDFIAYDTGGAADANTEILKNKILKDKNYKIVYVFDVSKYDSKETRHWLNMLLKEKREGENAGSKIDIIAIGTHANKSGLSKEQIASLENEIRGFQVKCRIYELNPDDRKDFHHPPLSSSEIKKYILG
ncbi:hypothetical protein V2I22_05525 [Campylobacter sp. CLAX-7218-21]|uniref:hypothetical protein n=1 Tax=Campylobacter devanensis TaxID=3161138 RepID=UPI002EC91A5F|nr:hypothetical protein [Campylobacter sp. CLAX-7218-21]